MAGPRPDRELERRLVRRGSVGGMNAALEGPDGTTWQAQRTSFGAVASSYHTFRPSWPAATAAWLTGTEPGGPLASKQPLDVLDLGAGTGKLSSTLAGA